MTVKKTFKFSCRLLAMAVAFCMLGQDVAMALPEEIAFIPRSSAFVENPYRIPRSIALAGEVYGGKTGNTEPTVILVEDAHTNPSGQMNLAQTLKPILERHQLSVIFTEGSDRDVSLSDLRERGTIESRAEASLPFVRKGELKGSEYLELTAEKDFAIVGVENKALYDRAVDLYAKAARVRGKLRAALERIETAVGAVETKLLNPRLEEFHAATRAYSNDVLSSAEYFAMLTARAIEAGVSRSDLRQLESLERVRKMEKQIDFTLASRAWEKMVGTLPPADQASLSQAPIGAANHGNLEETISAGARLNKALGVRKVPGVLRRYLNYLNAMERLDPHALLGEADRIERLVEDRLAVLPAEKRVLRIERSVGYLRAMSDLTLTPQGYAYLASAGDDADLKHISAFLNRQIMDLKIPAERAILLEDVRLSDLKAARDFYQAAFERDEAFVKNLMSAARARGVRQAVLITGGFHTPHLTRLLRDRGVPYRVLTPQVYEETDRVRYERLLLANAPKPDDVRATASALITTYAAETPGARLALEKAFGPDAAPRSGARMSAEDVLRPLDRIEAHEIVVIHGDPGKKFGQDVINLYPLLAGLRIRYPDARITLVSANANAFEGVVPGLDVKNIGPAVNFRSDAVALTVQAEYPNVDLWCFVGMPASGADLAAILPSGHVIDIPGIANTVSAMRSGNYVLGIPAWPGYYSMGADPDVPPVPVRGFNRLYRSFHAEHALEPAWGAWNRSLNTYEALGLNPRAAFPSGGNQQSTVTPELIETLHRSIFATPIDASAGRALQLLGSEETIVDPRFKSHPILVNTRANLQDGHLLMGDWARLILELNRRFPNSPILLSGMDRTNDLLVRAMVLREAARIKPQDAAVPLLIVPHHAGMSYAPWFNLIRHQQGAVVSLDTGFSHLASVYGFPLMVLLPNDLAGASWVPDHPWVRAVFGADAIKDLSSKSLGSMGLALDHFGARMADRRGHLGDGPLVSTREFVVSSLLMVGGLVLLGRRMNWWLSQPRVVETRPIEPMRRAVDMLASGKAYTFDYEGHPAMPGEYAGIDNGTRFFRVADRAFRPTGIVWQLAPEANLSMGSIRLRYRLTGKPVKAFLQFKRAGEETAVFHKEIMLQPSAGDSFMDHRLAIGSVDLSGVTEAVLLLAAIPTVVAPEPFDLHVLSFRVVPPVTGARMADADQRPVSKQLSRLEDELASLTRNWRSEGLAMVQAVRQELRATGPRTVHTRRASHVADHLEQMFLMLEPSAGRRHPQAGSGLAALTRRELVERLDLMYTDDDWSDNTLQVLQALTAIDGKTPAPKLKELIDHATAWTPRDLKILNALPRFVREAQSGTMNAATMKRFGERILNSSGESVRQRVQKSTPIRKAWKLAQRLAADAIAVRVRAARRSAESKMLLDRQKLPAPNAALVIKIARRLERQNTRRSRPIVITDRAVAAYILKNARPWKSARHKPSITSLQTQIAKRFIQKNWDPADADRMGKIRDEYVGIKTRSGNAWAVEGVRRGQNNRVASKLPLDAAASGARMSQLSDRDHEPAGTRRLFALPIPRFIPLVREAIAEQVYRRLSGIGEAMGLDEVYFSNMVRRILETGELRLALMRSVYHVRQKSASDPRGRIVQKIKIYPQFLGWQERWYRTWVDAARSEPDAAKRLRMMSMAEFLGDMGSESARESAGITPEAFVGGREQAYRGLTESRPNLLPPTVQYVDIPMAGGAPIPARLILPNGVRAGPAPIAIIYHGFGMSGDSSYFDELEQNLIQRGIAVLRPDLLSHGRSHRAMGNKAVMKDYNDAIATYLTTRADVIDPSRTAIYGFSFGGYLALRAALQSDLSGMIRSLVLMNPPTGETFSRSRIFQWHEGLLRELFPVKDFQRLVDKAASLRIPLHEFVAARGEKEFANMGANTLILLSDQDETIHFRDQAEIREFAERIGARVVTMEGQGHFAVGNALHAAYAASADHIARMLEPAAADGARMAHLSRGNEPPAEWFRKAILYAAERNEVARIITVCTANYHRSAALEWALGVETDIRGWDRIALDSGGTAWWEGNIPGFASAWDTLLPSLKNSFNVGQSEDMAAAVRTYLSGPGAAVNGSSALTDEEIGSLYHSFDPDRWRSLAPLENAERWSLLGDEIAQMIWDADLVLAGSIRLDNTGFKTHAREAARTYRSSSDDVQRLVSRQGIYDHPKPIARRTLLDADVILAASEHHRAAIVRLAPEVAGRIVTLRELDPQAFNNWFKGTDIPDPGQGQIDEFNLVRALWPSVQRLMQGLGQSATLLQGKPFAELIATEVRLRHIHEMIERYLLGSEADQFRAGGSAAPVEPTGRELQDSIRLKARLDWDQEQLEHNYRRSSDLAAELGSLVDEAEKSLVDAQNAAKSDNEKLWIRKLKLRLLWLRARIAEGWLERGEYLRARYVWGQVVSRATAAGVEKAPQIRRLDKKILAFTAYSAARQFLVQGDLSRADDRIALYQRAVPPNDPALIYLVAFRAQLEDRLKALGSEAPVQPAPRAPPVDEKLWMAGKAVSVHETPVDNRLVVKRALSASNDQEVDALRMAVIAAREGFTIESYGGYWLTRVSGFAPFAYLNSSIMLQKKLDKTLQPIDPAQIASSLQPMQATLLMKHTLEDRGILWLDPKPENIGFDVVDPGMSDGSSPLWTPVLLDFGFVYPIGDPPAKGARMASAAGTHNTMMLALSALDTASAVSEDPARPLIMENGFEKAERLLPTLAERGIGHLYLYGTADIGSSSGLTHDSFSSRVHTVPDRGAHDVWSKDGRVAVRVENYEVRREARSDGRTLDDAPGNIFSVMSLKDLHPGMGAPGDEQPRLRKRLRRLTQKAGSLGIKVILDFIPWRSPEAVNESNYKSFFYKELSADENRDYQALEDDEAARRAWISRLLERDKVGFIAVRVRENGVERVVLVRRFNFYGMNSADQVIMNPYHPETHRYFVESLKAMVDAGVAGVRVDLGHLLLPKHIRRYFDEMELLLGSHGETMESWLRASGEDIRPGESYAAWWERRNAGSLPWRQILAEVGSYAEERGKRFKFIIEAYDENDRYDLRVLGVDGSYKKPLFDMLKRLIDHPNMKVWEIERELFTVIDEKPSAVVFPSNFDQLSLMKMGGAIPAVQMLMVSLGAIQVPVIQDFREWAGQEGHLVKVPGGNNNPRDSDHHPFATDGEIRQRISSPLNWQSEALARSAWADMQEAVQRATGGAEAEDIRILNNSHRDRYLTFAWRANGRWFLSVSDFRAAHGKEGAADVLKVEMPAFMGLHGFDPSLLTTPKAVVGAEKILSINIGSWSREAVAGAATWDIQMRPADAGTTVDHTCFVDLGPSRPAPIRDVPHQLDQVLLEPYVYERQKELEDIIKSSVPRELKRDAFFMALLDHHHLLRAMAANAAAGRFEGMKPIPVNAEELLGFIHDPLEVLSRLETRRSWWPGVGEFYNDVRARRNGRYAMIHTLRFLKVGSDAGLLPRKTSGLAQNAAKLLRKRLRADAAQWNPAQETRIHRLINEEVRVALQGHTNADQDVSVGAPAKMSELELMRMIVVRADIVRQNLTPEGRDIFYWLLDAVQTLVPDEVGDPVADVVYRGKAAATGARMAQVAALSVGEHASKNEDSYLSMDLGNGWQVLGVFDGMGGEFEGAEASRRASEAVQKYFKDGMNADQQALLKRFKLELGDDTDARISALMVDAFVKAREGVQEIKTPKGFSSGTTFTLALVRQIDRRAPVAWVLTHGDSMAAVWDPMDPSHLMPVPGAYQMYDLNPALFKKEQERRAILSEIDDPKIGAIDAFSDEIERTHHKTFGLTEDDLPLIRDQYRIQYSDSGSEAAGFTLDEAEAWIFRRMTIGLTNLHEDAFSCAPPVRVEIPAGGTLVLATDGVWDNLRHSEAALILADEAEGRRADTRTSPIDKKLQDAAAALYNRSILTVHPGPERIPRARYKSDDITVVLYGRNWPAIDRTALEWQRIIRPAADRYAALNGSAKPTIAQLAAALARPTPPAEYKKLITALKTRPQAKRYEKSLRAIFRHHHPTLQPGTAGLESPRTTLTTKEWNKIFAQAQDDVQAEFVAQDRPVTLDDLYRHIQKRHPEWKINKLRTQAYRLGMTKKGRAEKYAPRTDSGAYDSWLRRLKAIKKRIPSGEVVTTNALSAASQKTADRLSAEEVRRAISSHPRLRGALQIQDARASNRFHREENTAQRVRLDQLLYGKDRDIAQARRVIRRMESTADAWYWYVLDQVIGLAGERPDVLSWPDLMNFVHDDLGLEPRFVEAAIEVWRKKFERSGARMAVRKNKTKNERPAEVDEYWKKMWRAQSTMFSRQRPKEIEPAVINELRGQVSPGDEIVDLGTGREAFTLGILSKVFPEAKFVAVEPNVEAAIMNAAMPENGRHVMAAAGKTGLKSSSVQAVVSTFGVDYEDRVAAAKEILRILKPGGRAVLVLHHPDSSIIDDQIENAIAVEAAQIAARREAAGTGKPVANEAEAASTIANAKYLEEHLFGDIDELAMFYVLKGFNVMKAEELMGSGRRPLGYLAVLEKPSKKPRSDAKGARMAAESIAGESDGIPTEVWEPVAYQQVLFNAQYGMHGRPSNVVVTMAQHVEQYWRQLMHTDLRVQIRREQKTARGISLLQIMGLGVRDQDSIEIGIAGDIDDAAAEAIVDIFAEMLRDRDLLGHGGHWRESLQRYYDRVDQAMIMAGMPTASGDLLASFGLGSDGLQSGVLGQFLTEVIQSHPSEERAHVAVETESGAVAIFCVWRDGREVWYALKGQMGRMRIESAPAMDLHTGAYSRIVDLSKPMGVEQVKKLDPASAAALDLSLAEGLLKAARQFAGADIGRQPVLANVELDIDDLLSRVGAADDRDDRARILKNLKSLQAKIRDEGFGRLLFRGDPDALPDAPTARLYRKDNLAYAASAAPGTIRWAYTQDQDQILPVLSSTILSALLAAAPIEGRDGYLDALTPLYQRLTGSADRLTAALLEEARNNPDRLVPIKPLSLRGYLDTAVYLQELARKSSAVAA